MSPLAMTPGERTLQAQGSTSVASFRGVVVGVIAALGGGVVSAELP